MINREERARALMEFDRQYKQPGIVIAGMDEVGRGPLAGNVVTACVVMPESPLIPWVDDSKKLSESRREKVYEEIMACALYVGIGEVSPEEIDRINAKDGNKRPIQSPEAVVPNEASVSGSMKMTVNVEPRPAESPVKNRLSVLIP